MGAKDFLLEHRALALQRVAQPGAADREFRLKLAVEQLDLRDQAIDVFIH